MLTSQAGAVALTLLLILLISRGRRRWAKRILMELFFIGLPALVKSVTTAEFATSSWIQLGIAVIPTVGIGALFMPSARDWFEYG